MTHLLARSLLKNSVEKREKIGRYRIQLAEIPMICITKI